MMRHRPIVYTGSLKFSPIFKSHSCAFGKVCKEFGLNVRYMFSLNYNWMLDEQTRQETLFIGSTKGILSMLLDFFNPLNYIRVLAAFRRFPPSCVYLHNYHLLNHFIAKLCKLLNASFIYHVHEPYIKSKQAHGKLSSLVLSVYEALQEILLRNTNVAIVSSREAYKLFKERYRNFRGKLVLIPLMYEDMGKKFLNHTVGERKWITFIGPPVLAKGPEKFLEIVEYCEKHIPQLKFLLITRKKLRDPRFFKFKNMKIFYKERITDDEIYYLISRSIAVITPYKRETQSSVVLTAYMCGTPVLSSNVGGLPEFIKDGKTGFLLSYDSPPDKWVERLVRICKNLDFFSKNARSSFVKYFSEVNWRKFLRKVLV